MFDAIAPLLGLAMIYLVIAIAGKAARKASEAQKASLATRSAAPADAEPETAPAPESAASPCIREMQPTIRMTEHDDSVYLGSLNAVTGEGYDPCHDAQMAPLTHAAAAEPVAPAAPASPGLQLNWTGDEIVRGFVISEILKRKGA